ncbi:MAG: LysM peptidoglycan-binding domain-containing protein [Spirochaetaceae bacterium]|jgi:nucleoid-associated protein YgaU|nr:LysM peptidoglycan-binding domain-containing protein [Spirochaetaceae bacterium]
MKRKTRISKLRLGKALLCLARKAQISFMSLLLFLVLGVISCATQPAVPSNTPKPVTGSTPARNPAPTAAGQKPAPAVEKTTAPRPSTIILEGARRHRVVWGDTLSSLSKKYYGKENGYYFPIIMLASSGVVFNPDVIIPGMILTIPDLNKNLADPQARSKIKSYIKDTAKIYEWKRDTKTKNRLIQLSNSL